MIDSTPHLLPIIISIAMLDFIWTMQVFPCLDDHGRRPHPCHRDVEYLYVSVPNMFSPQRRKGAETSRFFERPSSASLRLCGERQAAAKNMLGSETFTYKLAFSLLGSLPILLLYLAAQRHFLAGMTAGSVKS